MLNFETWHWKDHWELLLLKVKIPPYSIWIETDWLVQADVFFFFVFFYSAQWLFVFCLETARSALGDARTVLCVIKVPVHTWAELSSSVTYLQPLLFARQSRAYNCVPNTTVFFYYSDLAGQQAVISNISCVRKWRVQSYRFLSNVSADGVYDIISFGL